MRVFVAGATGAIGGPLVPALLFAGHEVWGLTRSPEKAAALDSLGAHGVVGDALDRSFVLEAVTAARPDVVMVQLTALPEKISGKAMVAGYAQTDRLRSLGTPILIEAARAAGAQRVIAQSIAFALAPEGAWVLDEDAPLYTDAPDPMGAINRNLEGMERAVVEAGGVVLRYGFFYGPGTWYSRDGAIGEMVRKRRYPVIGKGTGMASWIHIEDAVGATIVAMTGGAPGVYNVVDDHPAPAHDWIPAFAAAVGAKPPRRLPAWFVRRFGGSSGSIAAYYGTLCRGASNARFKQAFGWEPSHPDWREGFRGL